jgi:hypothetical protein
MSTTVKSCENRDEARPKYQAGKDLNNQKINIDSSSYQGVRRPIDHEIRPCQSMAVPLCKPRPVAWPTGIDWSIPFPGLCFFRHPAQRRNQCLSCR